MDDEALDPDIECRAMCLEAAIWYYDRTGSEPEDVSDLTNLAEYFLHYIAHGQANEFHSDPTLSKCVRGGI